MNLLEEYKLEWKTKNKCKIDFQLDSFKDAKMVVCIKAAKTTRNEKLQLNGEIFLGMNAQYYKSLQSKF
jgi:hypothetical protein